MDPIHFFLTTELSWGPAVAREFACGMYADELSTSGQNLQRFIKPGLWDRRDVYGFSSRRYSHL